MGGIGFTEMLSLSYTEPVWRLVGEQKCDTRRKRGTLCRYMVLVGHKGETGVSQRCRLERVGPYLPL